MKAACFALALASGCAHHRIPASGSHNPYTQLDTLLGEIAVQDLPPPDSFLDIRVNTRGDGIQVFRRGPNSVNQRADAEIHVVLCGRGTEKRRRAVSEYGESAGLPVWEAVSSGSCPESILDFNGEATRRTSTIRALFLDAFGVDGSAPVTRSTGPFRSETFHPNGLKLTPPANMPIKLPVRSVTQLACASCAPARPAAYRRR